MQGGEQNGLFLALKQGNVAMLQRGLKPTSRRSGQRRDVIESGTKRRLDVRSNVVTL